MLTLSNNTAIGGRLEELGQRFRKLYHGKAYVHHYTEYMEEERFVEADEALRSLVQDYADLEARGGAAADPPKRRTFAPVF